MKLPHEPSQTMQRIKVGMIGLAAVVLLIGIATSVFTAVVFTRLLTSTWVRRNRPTTINI